MGAEPLLLVNMFHPSKEFYFLAFPEIKEWGGLQRHGYRLTHILDKEAGIETARKWVEYCNGSINTPMGKLRARNGHPEPYHVKYWEMDNETWRWFTKEEYAIAVRKGDTDLQEKINAAIADMKANGEYDKLCEAFMPADGEIKIPGEYASSGDTIKMGTNASFWPFEYTEGNQVVGFDISMSQYVAQHMGQKLEVVNMDFDALIGALQAGSIDFIAAGMSVTPDRLENVDFSDAYYESEQVIIVRK